MNNAPSRCKGCSRSIRMIRLGMMLLCLWAILGPSAKAIITDEALDHYYEFLRQINIERAQQQEVLLTRLIAANDDLVSLNRANPYLPNGNINVYRGELISIYNDMILTQRIAKIVNALKKEMPRQQAILSKCTGQDKDEVQEIRKDIVMRAKIYKDFVCADRKGTSSKINTKNVCSSKIKDPSPVTKAEIINPYVAFLEKLQNITQQLAQAYPSEETDSAGENPSPSLAKQIAELEQDIQELITLGQTIKEENQA